VATAFMLPRTRRDLGFHFSGIKKEGCGASLLWMVGYFDSFLAGLRNCFITKA
jgi:hypothetical protein